MSEKTKVICYVLPNGAKVIAAQDAWLVAIISCLPPATLQQVVGKIEMMQQPGANGIHKASDFPLSLV